MSKSKLDEILENYKDPSERGLSDYGAKQQIKDLMLELYTATGLTPEQYQYLKKKVAEL